MWSVEGIPNAPYPSPKYLFIFRVDTSLFLFNFTFENLILHISLLIIIIIRCSGMFQNVPCSWFYRRPFQIDVLFHVFVQPGTQCKKLCESEPGRCKVHSHNFFIRKLCILSILNTDRSCRNWVALNI